MKKVLSCMLVIVMLTFTFTMVASGAGFVPSASYKPAPEIEDIVGHEHDDCIIITPVSEAEETDKIPEEKKDELLDQYEKLSDPNTKIEDLVEDLDDDLVIKDLFDVTITCDELGTPVDVVLKTTVDEDDEIYAIVYADGAWKKIPVKNNGNGTITVTLESEGIVALLSPASAVNVGTPETGDNSNVLLWIAVMLTSLALIVVLVIVNRRITVKEK